MALFGGNKEHFGLDIGTNAIRLVKLSGGPEKYILESFGTAEVPAGLTQSDSKLDLQKVAKIIQDLHSSTGIMTKNVVAAIPGTSVFNAVVKLPPMTQAELAKAIEFQAEQNIPLKLSEVKYDWQVIKQDPVTKELTVMIIAAAKSKVENMMQLFEYAGLNVLALETASVGMARSFEAPTEPLMMILDIGATTTEIGIVENGVLSQTRSFPLAGFGMTRAVSKSLGLDLAQSEQFKQKFGLAQDKLEGQVFKAIEPTLRSIMDEAVRSMKFYQEQSGRPIKRIVLTGGTARLPLLPQYIKAYTGTEVVIGNPWAKITYKPEYAEKINQMAPEFGTAVGLAMRI